MATMDRAVDRGRERARRLAAIIGTELREMRLAAGLSQAHVAHAARLPQSRISRTERAALPTARIDELARHASVLGLRLSIKTYPESRPVRDRAQLELLQRLRAVVSPSFSWRSEVPVGGHGDLRAWDVVLDGPARIAIDAETRLTDVQAVQRRVELKRRDSNVEIVVLAIAATNHNRRVLREHRAALATSFPLSVRDTLAALRTGRPPEADGIALL